VSRRVQPGQPGRALGDGSDDDPSSRRPHAVCWHGERAPAPTCERTGGGCTGVQGSPMAVSCGYGGRHGCNRRCRSPAELTACGGPSSCCFLGGRLWMLGRSSLRLPALDMELEAFIAWLRCRGGWKSSKLFARGGEILGHINLCGARTCCLQQADTGRENGPPIGPSSSAKETVVPRIFFFTLFNFEA
jgi:hypothetical protein